MRIGFQFRLVPFIAALLAALLGLSLGQWQLRRADEKRAIEARITAREALPPLALDTVPADIEQLEFRRVTVQGQFRADWPIYLDNRPHKGVAGFYLLMPLKLAGSDLHVLVARGWLPRNPQARASIGPYQTPAGALTLQGVVKHDAGHVMQLGSAEPLRPGAIVQNLDIATLTQAGKLRLAPFIVEQAGGPDDGLVRDWPRPSSGVDKHLGYAFQWFALAATALLFFIFTGFRSSVRDQAGK